MAAPLAIVLAAGKSTRMKSALPKVVHPLFGRPMVEYVFDAARAAGVERLVVVVGHRAEEVQAILAHHKDVEFALQTEQKGTGHAVKMCLPALQTHQGPVLILSGDTPLLKVDSLKKLLAAQGAGAAAVIGTARTQANEGLGRIVRSPEGEFLRIVEERDATPAEKRIQEINTGCYAFDGQKLASALERLQPTNAQGEYYLTDAPALLKADRELVIAADCFDIEEAMGVNTRVQLAEVAQVIKDRTDRHLMAEGVTIVDPRLVSIDPQAKIAADVVIEPFVVIRGAVEIGPNSHIGPHAVLEGPLTLPAGSIVKPFEHLPSR
ncbi:glycosyl transferase family 2 [Planctopirus hydrillae]|uniref:Glycosyl transferase family 2 n=2 Tax=Planctopirus hydrillae TaxID=1841610 RepID=A0A1C3E9P5_9PLAN|nr:glycosyl transferase family 2 [Planctopirus hydrillae]